MSAPTSSSAGQSSKIPRILACVLCQHRKIKCDRNIPCSNCIKANVTCTPSVPAPARKRRRPNQDLQERLARCEELLKKYASASAGPPGSTAAATTTAPTPASIISSAPAADSPAASTMTASPQPGPATVQSQAEVSSSIEPSRAIPFEDASLKWTTAGKVVVEDGSVRFMDSYLWANVYEELQAMRQIVDSEDVDEHSPFTSVDANTPDDQLDLLLNDVATLELEDVQPEPVQIFRLWQTFLDRVNPLTKIIHAPSVQPLIVESASGSFNVPLNVQALLFAIYNMAVISMTDAECRQIISVSRDEALHRYSDGVRAALIKANFLKSHDMISLQAFVLYMLSLQGRYDRHGTWVLSGVAIRIAQKMGLHRDGELLGLLPFDTEMRRRLWWQIIMVDIKFAALSGLSHFLLPYPWDTKLPQNINDADLFPGSSEPIQAREGPTEMVLVVLIYRLSKFILNSKGLPEFEAMFLGNNLNKSIPFGEPTALSRFLELIENMDAMMKEYEEKYCDPSAGPLHELTYRMRPMVAQKMMEMAKTMKEPPEWGTTEVSSHKDNLFKLVVSQMEHGMDMHHLLASCGFVWFAKLHFHEEVLAVMVAQLCQRLTGSLVDRAWKAIDRIYEYYPDIFTKPSKQPVSLPLLILKAWRLRERALLSMGMPFETPDCIFLIREQMPASEGRSSESGGSVGGATDSPTQMMSIETAAGDQSLNQFLDGYLDVSSLDWNVWGEMAVQGQGNALPPSFGDFGGMAPGHKY